MDGGYGRRSQTDLFFLRFFFFLLPAVRVLPRGASAVRLDARLRRNGPRAEALNGWTGGVQLFNVSTPYPHPPPKHI